MYTSSTHQPSTSNSWRNPQRGMSMERGVQGSRTWTRIVDLFRVHCEDGGRGTLSVDSGEDGARRINLSLNLQDGFIQRRVKPPGRQRRDQLRREAWLRRREAWCREERTPPGSNVSGAPDQVNRPVSSYTTLYTPGATGEGGQSGTRLDTDIEDNSWAAKIIRPPGGTSLTELGPAPTVDGGEHNVNEDATAPTPGQPCELTDDEMPNGNIPQLDGEDGEALCDDLDDEDSAVIVDFWVPRRRRNVIYSTLKNVTTSRDNIL